MLELLSVLQLRLVDESVLWARLGLVLVVDPVVVEGPVARRTGPDSGRARGRIGGPLRSRRGSP